MGNFIVAGRAPGAGLLPAIELQEKAAFMGLIQGS
jgi:hypothetical protein